MSQDEREKTIEKKLQSPAKSNHYLSDEHKTTVGRKRGRDVFHHGETNKAKQPTAQTRTVREPQPVPSQDPNIAYYTMPYSYHVQPPIVQSSVRPGPGTPQVVTGTRAPRPYHLVPVSPPTQVVDFPGSSHFLRSPFMASNITHGYPQSSVAFPSPQGNMYPYDPRYHIGIYPPVVMGYPPNSLQQGRIPMAPPAAPSPPDPPSRLSETIHSGFHGESVNRNIAMPNLYNTSGGRMIHPAYSSHLQQQNWQKQEDRVNKVDLKEQSETKKSIQTKDKDKISEAPSASLSPSLKKKSKAGVTSIYRGVSWNKANKSWKACIKVKGKNIHIGYFGHDIDAAKAYDMIAQQYRGEKAKVNFEESRELYKATLKSKKSKVKSAEPAKTEKGTHKS